MSRLHSYVNIIQTYKEKETDRRYQNILQKVGLLD